MTARPVANGSGACGPSCGFWKSRLILRLDPAILWLRRDGGGYVGFQRWEAPAAGARRWGVSLGPGIFVWGSAGRRG